ncbi:MAG: hypothetical protein Q8754_02690, partial [Sweet potato little leaf phytoplasma]|nr:hypothetical protein [Sweet potato little leaf phytoplasma]
WGSVRSSLVIGSISRNLGIFGNHIKKVIQAKTKALHLKGLKKKNNASLGEVYLVVSGTLVGYCFLDCWEAG